MSLNRIVGYQLVQAQIVTNANFMREVARPHKLRPVEFTILQLIRETPHISPTVLAKTLAMTTPSITAWLDKMSKRRLLIREKSVSDGRGQKLALTSSGSVLVEKALADLLASEDLLLSHLSLGEREMLLEILQKVTTRPTPCSDS
jgi:DNA-binding MarR family transcriptional regulator